MTSGAFAQTWTDITDGSGLSFTTKTGFGNPGKAGGSAAKDQVFELWTNGANPSFDLSQTVTEIPEGVYELSANAMYRSSLTYGTATNCVLYATVGSNTYSAPIKNYGDCTASESLGGVANAMVNHNAYSTSIPYIVVKDGSATIGMKNTDALTYCTNGYWFIYNLGSFTFKNVTDSYYSTLSARATEMISKAADGDAKTALSTALSTYSTATVDNIEGLKAAINTYLWTAASDANPIDVTSYIANPTFDGGSLKFWMQDFGYTQADDMFQPNGWDLCYSSAKVGNTKYQTFKPQTDGAKDGNCLYVRHRWSDVLAVEKLRQTVKELPAGKYTLTVAVKGGSNVTDANTLTLTAGANTKTTTVGEFDKTNYKDYSVTVIKNDAETNLDICYGFNQKSGGEQLYYIDDFRLSYCGEVVSDEDAEALIASIPTDAMYTGAKTAMQSAKEALEANKSLTNYKALSAAIDAANTSIADYANLKAAIDLAKKYTIVDDSYTAFGTAITTATGIYENGTAETCADAIAALDAAVKAAKVNDYSYVITNYNNPVALGTWTKSGSTGDMTGQHWSDDSEHSYMEQSSAAWGWGSWTLGYNQDVKLPAGNYIFKVAGRKAAGDGCTLELVVKDKATSTVIGTVNDFPDGDVGLGINKAGATSFDPDDEAGFANNGNGRGFQWRYVKFTLSADATINVAVNANATTSHQWVSFCDATVQTDNPANIAMITYNVALNDAKAAIANDTYKNVTGLEKSNLQTLIDADMTGKTSTEIESATTDLKEATTAFTAAAPAYDALVATLAKVEGLDAAGKEYFNSITEKLLKAYEANEVYAEYFEGIENVYKSAIKNQGANSDWTGLLVNPSFEDATGTLPNGWTTERNTTGTFDYKLYEETLNTNGTTDGKYVLNAWASQINYIYVKQIVNLPAGVYKLSAAVYSDKVKNQHVEAIADGTSYKSATVANNNWETLSTTFVVYKDGDVTVGIFSNGNNLNGDTYGWFRADNFKLTYLGSDIPVTIGESGYASFSATSDVVAPEGVEAFYASEVTETSVKMTKIEGGKIPANTGVILKGAKGEYTLTATTETLIQPAGNLLVAVTSAEKELAATKGSNTNYVLKNGQFVTWTEGVKTNVAAGKAYLSVPSSSAALSIDFGDATAINTVNVNTFNGARVNLAGQVVGNGYKGIVIENGKKVLVK